MNQEQEAELLRMVKEQITETFTIKRNLEILTAMNEIGMKVDKKIISEVFNNRRAETYDDIISALVSIQAKDMPEDFYSKQMEESRNCEICESLGPNSGSPIHKRYYNEREIYICEYCESHINTAVNNLIEEAKQIGFNPKE